MWNRRAGPCGALVIAVLVAAPSNGGGASIIDLMRERVLAHLDLKAGTKVAEIGVGPGWFAIRVAEKIGAEGVVYATDIDARRLEALRARLPHIGPGRVELRLCRDARDPAVDDLPEGHLDLVLMIDSLCFDVKYPRARNVDYLRRFLRVLRPGGKLVHHMDCRCDVTIDELAALFADAGFATPHETLDVAPDPAPIDASWPCRTAAERARHAFVGIFVKP